MAEELVKMSAKGQLVVPQTIRERQQFKPSDRFVALELKDGIVFKRVRIPDVRKEFRMLSKDIARQFQEKGIAEKDIDEAVRWARK